MSEPRSRVVYRRIERRPDGSIEEEHRWEELPICVLCNEPIKASVGDPASHVGCCIGDGPDCCSADEEEQFAPWGHEHEWATTVVDGWEVRSCAVCHVTERREALSSRAGR